ncbi:hypothetical protein M0R19_04825 [Candidatus Pacearchaeota archaeon]|jgi:hypothetical protein|nr:hypothetical protein [Candidatus Pacearchaeota archaeon]
MSKLKYLVFLLILIIFTTACIEEYKPLTILPEDIPNFSPSIDCPYYWNFSKKVYIVFTIDKQLIEEKDEITGGLFRTQTEIDKSYWYITKENFVVLSKAPLNFYINKKIKAYGMIGKKLEFVVLQIITVY